MVQDAEEGLCAGLNRRMGRYDDQLFHFGPVAGQMTPVSYIDSLTPDGFLNPEMSSQTYIKSDPSFRLSFTSGGATPRMLTS